MNLLIRILLLAAFLSSACAAPAAVMYSLTPTAAPTPTSAPSPTAPVEPTPLVEPTPRAQPLPTRVTREQGAPAAGQPGEQRKSLLEHHLPRAEVVAETEHFVFHAQDGYFPVALDWWLAEAETVYDYVSRRLGVTGKSKVQLGFLPPETRACPVRGLAAQETPPTVLIYADEHSPRAYLLAVLAHELGHAIPFEGFPGGLPDALALTEGLATWASGEYWAAWKQVASLDDLIRGYLRDGRYEPLHENTAMEGIYPWQDRGSAPQRQEPNPTDDCLARRDQLYSQWGSFLGYLVETYGWEKAHRLFEAPPDRRENGRRIEFQPDYEGVYGKALNQLEADWLVYLSRPVNQTARRFP